MKDFGICLDEIKSIRYFCSRKKVAWENHDWNWNSNQGKKRLIIIALRKRKPCHIHLRFPKQKPKICERSRFYFVYGFVPENCCIRFIAQCTRIKSQLETANGSKVYFFSNKIHLRFALYWPIAWLYESNSTKNSLKCKSCSDFGTIELTVYQNGRKKIEWTFKSIF